MRPAPEQIVLITGTTDGLGRALAEQLAWEGAALLMHGRDPDRLGKASYEISRATGNDRITTYVADLADLSEIRRLAETVARDHPLLDALVNNAGIGADVPGGAQRRVSANGHELRFAVNYLSGYLLTRLLLPTLRAAARQFGSARVVTVASKGQRALDFDDVMLTQGYSGDRAYTQSKLAQILFAFDLASELQGTGITSNVLHPASFMPTKIVANPSGKISDGVEATSRLVLDPALEGVTGCYFEGRTEATAAEQAYDLESRRQLRLLSEELTRLG